MVLNTDHMAGVAAEIEAALPRWDADVVLLIDCRPPHVSALRRARPAGAVDVTGFFCLYTPHTLAGAISMPRDTSSLARAARVNTHGSSRRYDLVVRGRPVTLYGVHLKSPRRALTRALAGDLSRVPGDRNRRATEARLVAEWTDRNAPGLIVAGDFNLTVDNRAMREQWGDLTNAFSAAGTGFGHTFFASRHRVRIDHVLTAGEWRPVRARVERGMPSDHQPLIVDLIRR
jgi:endonuclease/exonuclease/phosphatase (EEP) superfamily protein YafD